MAANLQSFKLASLGKRVVSRIGSHRESLVVPSSSIIRKRAVHDSVYNKNPEDLSHERGHSTVVPSDIIPPKGEQYWAPHPQTGVFGPATDQISISDAAIRGAAESVLEQKAFFRPLEDLDKPEVHP